MDLLKKCTLLSLLFSLWGCAPLPAPPEEARFTRAVITRTEILPQLPSGSDFIHNGGQVYIISDDAPYLFVYALHSNETQLQKRWITTTNSQLHRMPRDQKHDYEALVLLKGGKAEEAMILFGSGSVSPTREVISVTSGPGNDWQTFDAGAFYRHIRNKAGLSAATFNIEGAVCVGQDSILLLNRGSQQGFQFSWEALYRYFHNQGPTPEVRILDLPLPQKATYTFSGVANSPWHPSRTLVFSASQEATNDAQSDGAVLGSAIGLLEQKASGWRVKSLWPVYQKSGGKAREKIEGIMPDPKDTEHSGRKFLAITDNDDGQTKLLWIELQ